MSFASHTSDTFVWIAKCFCECITMGAQQLNGPTPNRIFHSIMCELSNAFDCGDGDTLVRKCFVQSFDVFRAKFN